MDLSTDFRKEIPSRNPREKRSGQGGSSRASRGSRGFQREQKNNPRTVSNATLGDATLVF